MENNHMEGLTREGEETVNTTADVQGRKSWSLEDVSSRFPSHIPLDQDRRRTFNEDSWKGAEILFTGYKQKTGVVYTVIQRTLGKSLVISGQRPPWGFGGLGYHLSDKSPMARAVPEPLNKESILELIKSQKLMPAWWAFRINPEWHTENHRQSAEGSAKQSDLTSASSDTPASTEGLPPSQASETA